MPNTWTHILLHCSATKDGTSVSWPAIRHYHQSHAYQGRVITPAKANRLIECGVPGVKKPWADIGYHFGIERIGNGYEILMGRMPIQPGAHCPQKGMNRKAIGICFVGNFDLAPPPTDQWRMGLKLVRSLMDIHHIPAAKVRGHREYAGHKSCPGRMFDLDRFRLALA